MSDPKSQPTLKEKHPPESARETTLPLQSEESARPPSSPHSLSGEMTSDSTPSLRREYDMIRLFEAVAKFRLRNGILPFRPAIIPGFLNEVKDFVPLGLSEGGLIGKLYKERKNFIQKPSPGPDCLGSDRYLYELQLKAFGLPSLCRTFKRNVSGSMKCVVTKKRRKASKKGEGIPNEDIADSGSSPS
ncbi:hypothetical protein KSP39_PZI016974 [Platanthera zijinensis]|uniref:Uncharacterized protein n=1 Tax=Platanthera zijinensis TaxID=2320716 RepID=A0AAP0B7E0_9ASPA